MRLIEEAVLADTGKSSLGDYGFSSDPIEEAADLYARILRRRPFSKANRLVGYECMRELLERNGLPWPRPGERTEEIVRVIKAMEAEMITVPEFADWIRSWVAFGRLQDEAGGEATA